MFEKIKNFLEKHPRFRKTAGVILIIVGVVSILTPFTPVGFLLIIGLEMLGIGSLFWEKMRNWFKKGKH